MSQGTAVADDLPTSLHEKVLDWYAGHARDLPWRDPSCSPWGVLVSEVMLQQTPVARVEPVWRDWMTRWPGPAELAAAPAGEAVRAWGRLGYPRRALRLHAAASALVRHHDGVVPQSLPALRALPGVGEYTAAAVAAFAYRVRAPVVDTNVRRVLARLLGARAVAAPSPTRAETRIAQEALPADPATAARWSVAVMELGALVCTARAPRCTQCPVREQCRWRRAGRPAPTGPARRGQPWQGTDRQCRGVLLHRLREAPDEVTGHRLRSLWPDPAQSRRALASLVADGLVRELPGDRYALPC